jgi:hypothetical protein
MAEQIVDGGFNFTQAELSDRLLFRAKVEASRAVLIKALAATGKPLTAWTSGQCVLQVRGVYETATCATCGQPTITEQVSVDA